MRELIKEAIKEKVLEHIRQKYIGIKTYNGTITDIVDAEFMNTDNRTHLEVYFEGERDTMGNLFADDICIEIKQFYGIDFVRYIQNDSDTISQWY